MAGFLLSATPCNPLIRGWFLTTRDVGRVLRGGSSLPSDQDIKELCAKLIVAQDPAAFGAALAELKTAIREHMIEAENRSIQRFLEAKKITDKIKSGTED